MEPEKKIKLQFNIKFDGKPSEEPSLALYAFDTKGACIAVSPVKNGQAQLTVSEGAVRRYRVFIAPVLDKERTAKVTIAMLERLCAYEPAWRFIREKPVIDLPPIPQLHWKCWPLCLCRIRGKVVRPVTIKDQTSDRPVCHARVHICEADPLFLLIPRLPDRIIYRIRDELLAALEKPIPFPPDPDPGPLDIVDIMAEAGINASRNTRDFAFSTKTSAENLSQLNPQKELPITKPLADLLSVETKLAFLSPSVAVVRQSLLDNALIIKPFWCHWPWIRPFFVRCDEVDVVETDGQGLFDSLMIYRCRGDHPDLYFWVEYNIGGVWTKVYHPRFPCHIHWNYPCGSLVTIRITDPRVPWCEETPQVPGKVLAITHIGKNVSICEILRGGGVTEGMTTSEEYFGNTLKPFGGSLEPNVLFGPDMLSDGINHYRWSYRRCGYSDGTDIPEHLRGDWYIMDAPVLRSYTEVRNNPPEYTMITKHVTLGPDTDIPQTLFKVHIGDYTLDPPPNYGLPEYLWVQWTPASDVRQNSASAFFLSHTLEGGGTAGALAAAGKYELKLELFRVGPAPDYAVTQVDFTADNVIIKTPLIPAPFGWEDVNYRTVPHDAGYPGDDQEDRVIRDPVTNHIMAFRLVLYVDNNPCSAEIIDAQVGSGIAGPCGFIQYPLPLTDVSPAATISFKASHPNKLARFVFTMTRGSSGWVRDACDPEGRNPGTIDPADPGISPYSWVSPSHIYPLVSDSPTQGYVRDPATRIFTKDIPVNSLLGDCDKASFAENLSVYALAYDGWSRLYYLDAYGMPKSFALEPEPPV
jgi:hypothetical protein